MTLPHIPTVAEAVAALPLLSAETLENVEAAAKEYGGIEALYYALAKDDYKEADEIMARYKWTPTSIRNPEDHYYNNCSLMWDACNDNGYKEYEGAALRLYHYLVQRDPTSPASEGNQGGNMLHAWVSGGLNLSIYKDLLEHGADPLQKDNEGCTPMDRLKELESYQKKSPEEVELYLYNHTSARIEKDRAMVQGFSKDDPNRQKFLDDLDKEQRRLEDPSTRQAIITSIKKQRSNVQIAKELLEETIKKHQADPKWAEKVGSPMGSVHGRFGN